MMDLFEKYRAYISENRNAEPVFSRFPVDSAPIHKWVGGCLSGGTLYCTPNDHPSVLALNPADGSARLVGDFGGAPFKWSGECQIGKKIFFFPRAVNDLICFDPETGAYQSFPALREYVGEHHYGGVFAGGKIWQPPRNTDHLLVWEPDGHCSELQIADRPVRYCASVYHPDGFVYFLPERQEPILRLDPKNGNVTAITPPVTTMVFDAKVAADGCIYGYSSSKAGGLLRLDPEAKKAGMLFPEICFRSYGTKIGANGRLYGLPGWEDDLFEYTPETGTLRTVYRCGNSQRVRYAGGTTDRNGNIYAVPVYEDHILCMTFHGTEIPADVYDAFFSDPY